MLGMARIWNDRYSQMFAPRQILWNPLTDNDLKCPYDQILDIYINIYILVHNGSFLAVLIVVIILIFFSK